MGKKKPNARTFGQDLMRGEGGLMPGKKRSASARPGGPNGGAGAGVYLQGGRGKKPNTNAVGTQDWVQQKIAEGDIAGGMASNQSGTSIFDPVLTELCYRWFCPPGGQILDPFAGGSVRGIVASFLGRSYTGLELRPEQIEANRHQAAKICGQNEHPIWIEGDSQHAEKLLPKGFAADFVFSCPPYADLEVYSEDPRDLSTMDYPEFLAAYDLIIAAACARLKEHRFAAFVVGDVRDKGGYYRGFPWHTIQAFERAGLRLYNEAVLVTAAGSLPMRVNRQFSAARKLGKTHQNVLVFCKGDWRKACEAIGPVEFGEIDTGESSDDKGETDSVGLRAVQGKAREPSPGPPASTTASEGAGGSNSKDTTQREGSPAGASRPAGDATDHPAAKYGSIL
jgi:hypothetical protein